MSRSFAVALLPARPRYRDIARIVLAAAALCAVASIAEAKTAEKWEFSVNSGRLFSAGTQPDVIKGADYTAAQLAYILRPNLAITGSLGWARSRDISAVGSPKLDIFTYALARTRVV